MTDMSSSVPSWVSPAHRLLAKSLCQYYRELREQVGDEHIGVIPEDSYYKIKSHLSMEERVHGNQL